MILKIQGRSFIQDIDELVESLEIPFSVIPAKAGIHLFQIIRKPLDTGFHR